MKKYFENTLEDLKERWEYFKTLELSEKLFTILIIAMMIISFIATITIIGFIIFLILHPAILAKAVALIIALIVISIPAIEFMNYVYKK